MPRCQAYAGRIWSPPSHLNARISLEIMTGAGIARLVALAAVARLLAYW
jgi:hypothetical protein